MSDDDALLSAVRAIWDRSRDAIMQRVAVFEQAAASAVSGDLLPDPRRNAEREVHKLAGAVGTFGFWDSSTLAKEAEALLHGDTPIAPADALRLTAIAAEVRRQLERGPGGPAETEPTAPEPPKDRRFDAVPPEDKHPGAAAVSFTRRAHPTLLIIGNDRDFRDRMVSEARSLGVDILEACSVEQARSMLTEPVDAAILDLTLPDVGFSFLEEIHTTHPELPVIVVSDGDEFQDRVEAARLGGRGFLQKPVRPSQLIELLRDSLVAAPNEVSTIVAVDDDPELLALIQSLLQPIGARVVTVTDSFRVLNVLVEHAPDLVMLDVDMPGLNGIELCRVLRNDPRWAALPVLFLTAQSEPGTVMRMFEAGADDFVAKPVLGPELVARVRNRLERTRMLRLAGDVDSLTGVATRRRGIEVLERIFRLAQRQRQLISVAAIDLDHFKQVNDRFGHLVGDMVLRRIATILSTCFRGEDVVARWGGEEFVVAIYSMPSAAATRRLNQALERLRTEVFEAAGTEPLTVTFSAGVAEFPADGSDWTAVYRVADEALSRAKTEGRNRVVCVPHDIDPTDTSVDVAIVNDDEAFVRQFEPVLHQRGYRTTWIRDGASAVQQLGGPSPTVRARVIVIDAAVSANDGFAVLRSLAHEGLTPRSRVVMITDGAIESEVQQALELVAFAHVAKPLSVTTLVELVRGAMSTRQAKR